MKIIVMIKQVPGTSQVEVDPATGVLKRDGVAGKMNPYDLFAVEEALRLRERYGGTVNVITMGPGQAGEVIREAVYIGADGGSLVSDRKFGGADVLATAYTLSQCIQAMGGADLILCGKQTTDGDTAQVGPETAEFLGIPHTTNVLSIDEVTADRVELTVNMDFCESVIAMPLPCLITMEKDVNTPRLPSIKRRFELGQVDYPVYSLADMKDTDPKHYGLNGSATQVERIFPPEKNTAKEIFEGSAAELSDKVLEILDSRKFI